MCALLWPQAGRGDDAMRWIREVEKDGATFESLQRTGSKYESLDQKLAAALHQWRIQK